MFRRLLNSFELLVKGIFGRKGGFIECNTYS